MSFLQNMDPRQRRMAIAGLIGAGLALVVILTRGRSSSTPAAAQSELEAAGMPGASTFADNGQALGALGSELTRVVGSVDTLTQTIKEQQATTPAAAEAATPAPAATEAAAPAAAASAAPSATETARYQLPAPRTPALSKTVGKSKAIKPAKAPTKKTPTKAASSGSKKKPVAMAKTVGKTTAHPASGALTRIPKKKK